MIDKRLSDKPIYFEISMGNAGNNTDGDVKSAAALQSTGGRNISQLICNSAAATGLPAPPLPGLPMAQIVSPTTAGRIDDGNQH